MAELTLLSYRPGGTWLHAMDVRVKLAAVIGISMASVVADAVAMGLATVLALVLLRSLRISPAVFLYEIRYFLLILAAIFLARTLSTPGESVPLPFLATVTVEGLVSGAMICWRLLLVVILGLGLTASSRPALIRQGVQWFLKPLPGVPHEKIGTMMGLLVRFLPLIWMRTRMVATAQRARCIDARRNPVYRMARLGMGTLRNIIVSADRLAWAMEARNYGHERTPIPWRMRWQDWLALAVVAILCIGMIWGRFVDSLYGVV